MHMTGFTADGTVKITDGFLLGIAIMFEIPFLMIVLSWVLKYRQIVGQTSSQLPCSSCLKFASLFLGVPSPAYIFYSTVEIASSLTHSLECMEMDATLKSSSNTIPLE